MCRSRSEMKTNTHINITLIGSLSHFNILVNQEAVSTDQIKRLSEINESDVQGHLLFSALLL